MNGKETIATASEERQKCNSEQLCNCLAPQKWVKLHCRGFSVNIEIYCCTLTSFFLPTWKPYGIVKNGEPKAVTVHLKHLMCVRRSSCWRLQQQQPGSHTESSVGENPVMGCLCVCDSMRDRKQDSGGIFS